jgi:hypothetical protein
MGSAYWMPWSSPRPRKPHAHDPASRRCGAPGSATTTGRRTRGAPQAHVPGPGYASRPTVTCHVRLREATRPMIPPHAIATSAIRNGPATWCLAVRPASPPLPTCCPLSIRPPPPSMRRNVQSPVSRRWWRKPCLRASIWSMRRLSAPSGWSSAKTRTASPGVGRPGPAPAGKPRSKGGLPSTRVRWSGCSRAAAARRAPGRPRGGTMAARPAAGPSSWSVPVQLVRPVPRARSAPGRTQAQDEALRAARTWVGRVEGKAGDQRRAGVEGTLSPGVRAVGLRCARYRGLANTHWQHVATAAAMPVDRSVAWLDARPRAKTRTSRVAALAPACRLPSDAPSL